MNKCYGCDLCDDACDQINAGDKLNIITTHGITKTMVYLLVPNMPCTNACCSLSTTTLTSTLGGILS